jgi:ABC-2 type transport system permease protein
MWGPALRYSPAGLTAAPTALATGEPVSLAWPIGTGVVLAAVLVLATIVVFRRREL